ncbi:hypothetical protein VNO80_07096 [Phaseolus coccineus]
MLQKISMLLVEGCSSLGWLTPLFSQLFNKENGVLLRKGLHSPPYLERKNEASSFFLCAFSFYNRSRSFILSFSSTCHVTFLSYLLGVVPSAAVVVPAMGQQSLIYSFVARGTVILAEYTEFTGNFTGVAAQCLQKLPSSNNKFTYNCDGHTFNYLVDNGFTYCVVAVESAGRQIPIAFLERIKEDFTKKYAGGKAATAAAQSLNREFGPKLKEQMQYCVDHPEEVSKLAKVKAQVSEVKGVMMENIEKVLDRGEKIELLVDKTENLRSQAQDFRQQGTKIRRKMWFQNMKIKLIVLGIIIALILIIVLSVCGGFNCGK